MYTVPANDSVSFTTTCRDPKRQPFIAKLLVEGECKANRVGIAKFLEKYRETGCIGRRIGSGRPLKIMAEIKATVD